MNLLNFQAVGLRFYPNSSKIKCENEELVNRTNVVNNFTNNFRKIQCLTSECRRRWRNHFRKHCRSLMWSLARQLWFARLPYLDLILIDSCRSFAVVTVEVVSLIVCHFSVDRVRLIVALISESCPLSVKHEQENKLIRTNVICHPYLSNQFL